MKGPRRPPQLLSCDAESIAKDFERHFHYTFGRDRYAEAPGDVFAALALAARDRVLANANRTRRARESRGARQASYLSMEYLLGRTLGNALLNLDLDAGTRGALGLLGLELEDLASLEHDAGLGNGGLGRLAACFLDSAATLGLPLVGYGLRYRYGMFRQRIVDGCQVEEPDHWLREGHPWELERPELTQRVRFGGRSETTHQPGGRLKMDWVDTHDVLAVPFDVPVPGYRNGVTNTLRLWSAAATDEFDLGEFNAGSYPESVEAKNDAEHISMVLYPNDASENGKVLRLRQQYFLAAASLADVVRDWVERQGESFDHFADKHCFQLNDTHPSLAVAELMRILMDEHGLEWADAWRITTRTTAYTNHTLLPEALERWPVRMLRELLPRPLEIIEEINTRFLAEVAQRWPDDADRQHRMSIIEGGNEPMVRMAYLAIVGSYSVNGVAALHTRLLTGGLFRDFHELWPERFNNKTNGITPRRWLAGCNPGLAALLDESIGQRWRRDLGALGELRPLADDSVFRDRWRGVKQQNKRWLAALVESECAVRFDPESMLSVQVKRIHEYKRQLLNVLHLVHLYARARAGEPIVGAPRCVLLAGKAAPGYFIAKLIIRLINAVARAVNEDEALGGRLRVAFLPDYRVTSMEVIAPAADLSQQLSTAGKEASGTGNMKLMMNGALTIGTLDGANIEILEAAGAESFYVFGLDAHEVEKLRSGYAPDEIVRGDEDLNEVMALLSSGHFSPGDTGLFQPLVDAVLSPHDPWMTAADFRSYVQAEARAAGHYLDTDRWTRMSILNCASSGRFSSDRTIADYNDDIWKLSPVGADGPDA